MQIVDTRIAVPFSLWRVFYCFSPSSPKDDVTRDNLQHRCLAQHSITALLRHCFEWLQHWPNIATLCCAENGRCKSSLVAYLNSDQHQSSPYYNIAL